MRRKIFATIFVIFIVGSWIGRIFAITTAYENDKQSNGYLECKKRGNKILEDQTLKGVIINSGKKLEIIKIHKQGIGLLRGTQKLIDREGNLFKGKIKNYITISGDPKLWPKIYEKLEEANLVKQIYAADLSDFKINLYMYPGILIKLPQINPIQILKEFKNEHPKFFKKGAIIDLRVLNRIGIIEEKKEAKEINRSKKTLPIKN